MSANSERLSVLSRASALLALAASCRAEVGNRLLTTGLRSISVEIFSASGCLFIYPRDFLSLRTKACLNRRITDSPDHERPQDFEYANNIGKSGLKFRLDYKHTPPAPKSSQRRICCIGCRPRPWPRTSPCPFRRCTAGCLPPRTLNVLYYPFSETTPSTTSSCVARSRPAGLQCALEWGDRTMKLRPNSPHAVPVW